MCSDGSERLESVRTDSVKFFIHPVADTVEMKRIYPSREAISNISEVKPVAAENGRTEWMQNESFVGSVSKICQRSLVLSQFRFFVYCIHFALF